MWSISNNVHAHSNVTEDHSRPYRKSNGDSHQDGGSGRGTTTIRRGDAFWLTGAAKELVCLTETADGRYLKASFDHPGTG